MDKVQFVAEQLRKIAPTAPWDAHEIDRAVELAQILVRAGVTDLWALKLVPVSYTVTYQADVIRDDGTPLVQVSESDAGPVYAVAPGATWTETFKSYAFDYYGRRIGYLGTPDEPRNDPYFEPNNAGFLIAWSSVGKGHINYVVRPNAAKTGIEIAPVWGSSSDADFIRESLVSTLGFFAMVALPLAGVSLGAVIGNAVLPASFTAAYPAVASAVGNIALSTALNGGDIAGAVKGVVIGAASGFAGANVGGFAQTISGSQLIGNLAEVATRTALSGGDVKTAVGFALAKEGVNMFDFGTAAPVADSSGFDLFTTGTGGDFTVTELPFGQYQIDVGNSFDMGGGFLDPSMPLPDFQYTNPFPTFEDLTAPGGLDQYWGADPVPVNVDGSPALDQALDSGLYNPFVTTATGTPTIAPSAPTTPPAPNSSVWNPMQIIQGITAAAMAAISVIKAYRSLDQPRINTTARVVRPDGSVSVITDNGLVSTRTPDGRVTSTRPPVGVPQSTVNGNTVVNNGDGTYTVVSPNGQTATYRYDAAAGAGGKLSPMTLALLAGGAFLLLRK